jgi:hypothetical protein
MPAKNEPSPDTSLEGVILQIKDDQTLFDGGVVILAPINGAIRKVRTTFLENDRTTVFEAGQQKQEYVWWSSLRGMGVGYNWKILLI